MRPSAVLGKYELVEALATGGMAELFLARSRGPAGVRKTVVIKRIRPEYTDDPRFVNLFINEARIGMQLTHPNIVHVYDLGRAQGTWYIAMEHVHGRDLMRVQRMVRAAGARVPVEFAVTIVAELLRGLHYAHTRTTPEGQPLRLVHHDVSPHNVLVGFDGHVKLVDFGIARVLSEGPSAPNESGTPAGRGKLAYRSPEATHADADHRVDIYGAGVVLWELLAGHRPYHGLDATERRELLASKGIPALEGIDAELAAIVDRACDRDPDSRPRSAGRFEEDLRAWLYQAGHRVTADHLAAWMDQWFPGQRTAVASIDTGRLVEDLVRLETEAAPTPSAGRSLPGRLQQSPGERKQVAVLVVDVDGLTALSAELEPEQFVVRHFRLLRWVRRIVDRWGGIIQRAVDDHLVILFGVPRTREDDLSRALDCALDLMRRRGELEAKGLSMEFCIGVHAGEVTITMARRRVQYLARGNTTRLARRLSAAADHGEILVSERVLGQMEADFRLAMGPAITSRGGGTALPSYRLHSRRKGVRLARRGPWMRRGDEIEKLRAGLEKLVCGTGSALALVGPMGAGKSRLIRELEHLAVRRGVPFQVVRCSRFGHDPPFADLVRLLLGVNGDPVEETLTASGLSTRVQDALRWLLGLASPVPDAAEARFALLQLLHRVSEGGPMILAVELEGLDVEHISHLAALVERARHLPLLFLFATRPPMDPRLASQVDVVELGAFPVDALQRMTEALLDVDTVEPELMDLIERTCEGNPLYLEEMIKFLLGRGSLSVADRRASLVELPQELPHTLLGLLSARIDALEPASKGVLQLASVIGATFTGPLLDRAAGLEDASPLLMELEACGLVVRSGEDWSFASSLTREAASRGILGVQRRDYHRLVSEAIEDLYGDDLTPWADELAEHCARGGRWIDAARYALKAGQQLEHIARLEDARRAYRRGLSYVGNADDPDEHDARTQGEAALNMKVGAVSLLLGEVSAGRAALSLSLDISGDAGLPWIESRAHLLLGRSHLEDHRYTLASAHLGQAVAMADDIEVELEALEVSAMLELERGRHAEAEAIWEKVLKRADGEPRLTARCLTGLATKFMQTGFGEEAEPRLHEALKAARACGDRILEGRVLNNIGMLHSIQGDHQGALAWFRRALQLREGIGYSRGLAINHHNIGDAHFHLEQWPRAYVAFSRSRDLAEQTGWTAGCILNDAFLTYLDARRGESRPEALEDLVEQARSRGDHQLHLTAAWLHGRLLLESGEAERGRQVLVDALEQAERGQQEPEAQRIREALA